MPTDLDDILSSAHNTLDPVAAQRMYLAIREESKNDSKRVLTYVSATRELAYLATSESKRAGLWKDGYKRLSEAMESSDVLFLQQTAILLKDIIVDEYSGVELAFQSRELARLLRLTSTLASDPGASANDRSRLLARRSSLLRLRSERFDITGRIKKASLEEAIRSAEKAVAESKTTGSQFELALCLWANSNAAKSDEEYRIILEEVERLLLSPQILEIDVAKLTLSRFYRTIYRPLDACESFQKVTEAVRHHRRILAEAGVYAEAAIHLWFQKFPESIWRPHCEGALLLTQNAIDSGYRNARMLVNLAYLYEILGQPHAATTSMREIANVPHEAIWDKLIEFCLSPGMLDAATEGLCFGLGDGSTWTRLGTYAWVFLDDTSTAKALYEFAVKLSPRNPVALTNLARFHIRSGTTDINKLEAEKLLQRASSYAGRRFRWWRVLLDELRPRADGDKDRRPRALPSRPKVLASELNSIKARYRQLLGSDKPQERGYELECLIFDLANISFTLAAPSYRFKRDEKAETQIDGYIEHRGEKYRIECKWEKEPVSKDCLIQFVDALDVAGISGLFVSMSGFSPSFLQRVREYRKDRAIILFDREDIELAIEGKANFDELLTFKRMSFDKASESFAKLAPFQD